jgi:hypothetical protein
LSSNGDHSEIWERIGGLCSDVNTIKTEVAKIEGIKTDITEIKTQLGLNKTKEERKFNVKLAGLAAIFGFLASLPALILHFFGGSS